MPINNNFIDNEEIVILSSDDEANHVVSIRMRNTDDIQELKNRIELIETVLQNLVVRFEQTLEYQRHGHRD